MAERTMRFELPFPPTVNTYTTVARGRKILSQRGRAYKDQAVLSLRQQMVGKFPLCGMAMVSIELHPPDKRARDADNCCKGVLDALVRAGVIEDDNNRWVGEVRTRWSEQVEGGKCIVTVEVIEGATG